MFQFLSTKASRYKRKYINFILLIVNINDKQNSNSIKIKTNDKMNTHVYLHSIFIDCNLSDFYFIQSIHLFSE